MMLVLVVVRMESMEEGPGVTLDKPRIVRDKLTGRLEMLRQGGQAC